MLSMACQHPSDLDDFVTKGVVSDVISDYSIVGVTQHYEIFEEKNFHLPKQRQRQLQDKSSEQCAL